MKKAAGKLKSTKSGQSVPVDESEVKPQETLAERLKREQQERDERDENERKEEEKKNKKAQKKATKFKAEKPLEEIQDEKAHSGIVALKQLVQSERKKNGEVFTSEKSTLL